MRHRPRWNRVPAEIRNTVHDSLTREHGYICCYCEQRVSQDDSHVEHFRPVSRPEFSPLQLCFTNLHCSCQREMAAGEPHHCGYSKADWFDEDLLISPLAPDCEDRFMFTGNGQIFPRCDDDEAARTTLAKLAIDLPQLAAMRAKAVDALYDEDLSKDEIAILLGNREDGGFQAFFTTIRQVLLD